MMEQIGRSLLLLGAALAAVGLVLWGLGRIGFRGLPGDIRYQSDGVTIFFPIATCLVLSIVLSAIAMLWQWWRGG